MDFPFIIITFVTLAVILGVAIMLILVYRKKGTKMTGKDYRAFFVMGLSYLVVGIIMSFTFPGDVPYFNFFVFMGIIFTAMGLSNIDKWKQ